VVGEQVPRGFWVAAREEPERLALIDAAGRAWSAGELLAGANKLVHALRARGVQPFDPVATLTRNSAELFQVLLAVFQGGWQYVPLNTHLTAAELAYILGDSGATALFADADLADVATAAAEDAGVPAAGRVAIGGDIPGFTSLGDVLEDQPCTTPDDRVAGQFMQYTSGGSPRTAPT
jgi:long-chain acyl-CoA synthetase